MSIENILCWDKISLNFLPSIETDMNDNIWPALWDTETLILSKK